MGVNPEEEHFDPELMVHINSVLMSLNQMGVGKEESFVVRSRSDQWFDFLGADDELEAAKTYMYLKVKLLFDPPTNAFAVDSLASLAKEYAWRLNTKAERGELDEQIIQGDRRRQE